MLYKRVDVKAKNNKFHYSTTHKIYSFIYIMYTGGAYVQTT